MTPSSTRYWRVLLLTRRHIICARDQPDLFLIDGIFVFAHVFGLRPVKLHLV